MDPYILLNLNDDADDALVKAAYLTAVHAHPPERDPEMFEAVRAAYEQIASQRQRLKHQLFESKSATAQTVLYASLGTQANSVLPEQAMRQVVLDGCQSVIKKNLST